MDRKKAQAITADMEKALEAVARKHGGEFKLFGGRFDGVSFKPRVEFHETSSEGVSKKVETALDTLFQGRVSLGTKFKAGGTVYTVTGAKLSRWKYPVSAKGPRGGQYKFTTTQVETGLKLMGLKG